MDQNQELERCLECTACRKPIHTCYITCSQSGIQRFGMCSDCPMLKKKLYGQERLPQQTAGKDSLTSICCGGCGLTRDEVIMGAPLGCSLCYEVFQDAVFYEINNLGTLQNKNKEAKETTHLHIGKTPAPQHASCPPTATLVSLQKMLQETLKREDYEQAAWIRDKIKALSKPQNEPDNGTSKDKPQTT